VEGLVADRNLTLGDLIGTIRTFFERIGASREGERAGDRLANFTPFFTSSSTGITDLKFKPAYNPYTEPSMEIFGYHPDLKKYVDPSLTPSLPPSFPSSK